MHVDYYNSHIELNVGGHVVKTLSPKDSKFSIHITLSIQQFLRILLFISPSWHLPVSLFHP
ncbi:hypothetical protein Hanom_Chr14g01270751 [Helianthus anomalus]